MTAKEILKLAQKNGWIIKSQKGSHIKLQHSDGRVIIIPYHGSKDIKIGTAKQILKQLGIEYN